MSNPIVDALMEDEDFVAKLQSVVEEMAPGNAIDAAISEHDMILNLISRSHLWSRPLSFPGQKEN